MTKDSFESQELMKNAILLQFNNTKGTTNITRSRGRWKFQEKNNNKTKRKQFQLIFIENFPYESHTPIYIVDWDAQDGSDLVGWWDFRIWVRKRKLEFDRTTKRYIFWALHPAESLTHSYKSLAKDFTENQWN